MEEYPEAKFSNLDRSLDPIKAFTAMIIPAYYSYLNMSKKNTGGQYTLRGVAMQCSNLLFNYREYLKRVYDKEEMTHKEIETACPDWGLIRDISNAEKHFILDNPPGKYINNITDVQEAMVYDTFPLPNGGNYVHYKIRVVILLKDYKIRDLLEVATNVLNFWGEFLLEKGAIKEYEKLTYKGNDFLSQEDVEAMPDPKVDSFNFETIALIGLIREYDINSNCFEDKYHIYHNQ